VTVTTIYSANNGDSNQSVYCSSATYSTAREGSGSLAVSSSLIGGQLLSSGTYYAYQGFVRFDTSSISDSDTVSSVTLSVNSAASLNCTDSMEARGYDYGGTVATADFRAGSTLGSYTLLASRAATNYAPSTWYDFTSETAFKTATGMKTGYVNLLVHGTRQRTNVAPVVNSDYMYVNGTGSASEPYLTITHAPPSVEGSALASLGFSATAIGEVVAGDYDFSLLRCCSNASAASSGWTKLTGTIAGAMGSTYSDTKLPPGTAYIKPGFELNQDANPGTVTRVGDVKFRYLNDQ